MQNRRYGYRNVFFVSAVNNDEPGDGSCEYPFSTISEARNEIRKMISEGMESDMVVYIRGGEYLLEESLIFTDEDSGRDGYSVIYRRYPGEEPIINGGIRITGWQPAEKGIYKVEGVDWEPYTLYENAQRAVIARHPNRVEGNNQYNQAVAIGKPRHEGFYFKEGDVPFMEDITGLEVFAFPGGNEGEWNWFSATLPVKELDFEQRRVDLVGRAQYTMGTGSRYFIQGARELLDQPGEFYYNRLEKSLYFWPYHTSIDDQSIIAPMDFHLMEIHASNIVFDGLTFRNTERHRNGILITNAKNVGIRNCRIYNTGENGIVLGIGAAACRIEGNSIHDIGNTSVLIAPIPGESEIHLKPETQGVMPHSNVITNNHIFNGGQMVGHGAGIQLMNTSSNIISHNLIHDMPRYAISFKGPGKVDNDLTSDNIIEFNELYRVNTDTQDTGIIEAWFAGPNNIIRNNSIHDSGVKFSFGTGIYMDDHVRQSVIEKNIIYNLQKFEGGELHSAVMCKGDRHRVVNNIIASNNVLPGAGVFQTFNMNGLGNEELIYMKNIAYNNGPTNIHQFVDWQENRVRNSDYNLYFNEEKRYTFKGCPLASSLKEWKEAFNGMFDQNSTTENPGFMDPQHNDFRLRFDSPAHQIGFEEIDFQSIGLTKDYPFADANDPLSKVFVRQWGDSTNRGSIRLMVNDRIKLEIMARSYKGYVVDLADAAIDYHIADAKDTTMAKEIIAVESSGHITAKEAGIALVRVSVTKDSVTKFADIYIMAE